MSLNKYFLFLSNFYFLNIVICFIALNHFSLNHINSIKLYKKYTYFLKKKRSYITNFLCLNVLKSKISLNRRYYTSSNLLDYKKRMLSVILDNRKIFNIIFLQNKMTKRVSKAVWLISKLSIKEKVFFFNNQLWLILIKSSLATSKRDVRFLFFFNNVSLNFNIINRNCTLSPGDFISLCYNKFYFNYLLYRQSSIYLFIKRFRRKYINLSKFFFKNFLKTKEFKKNKIKMFKYLFFFKNFRVNNLEIDFNIMSIYILNTYIGVSLNIMY